MLHSQTTLILAALLFVMLPFLVWWTTTSPSRSSVLWWCAGSLLAGLGIALMGLRPWIAGWASYHGGNTLLILSLVGWSQSLRLLLGRPWSRVQMGLWAIGALTYYSVLYGFFEPNTRGLGMRTLLGLLALYTAWLAFRLGRRWQSHNALAISITYVVLGLGLLWQVLLHGGGGQTPGAFSNTWDASVLATLVLVTSAIAHLCYSGMVIDQASLSLVQNEAERVAVQESAWLQSTLRQNDRRSRLVLVSGSLAHELNQPLTAALTQTELIRLKLRRSPWDTASLASHMHSVETAIERASQILERTRQAARSQALQRRKVHLCEVVRGTCTWLEAEWQRLGITLRMAPPDPDLCCLGDEVALTQLLLNLLRNATQALESSPRREIRLHCQVHEEHLDLLVRDTGTGLSEKVLSTWGEPFVSTRSKGLGMGLAISREIARQHGGQLLLCNHPDGGAQAMLRLPRLRLPVPEAVEDETGTPGAAVSDGMRTA